MIIEKEMEQNGLHAFFYSYLMQRKGEKLVFSLSFSSTGKGQFLTGIF